MNAVAFFYGHLTLWLALTLLFLLCWAGWRAFNLVVGYLIFRRLLGLGPPPRGKRRN